MIGYHIAHDISQEGWCHC